jgi:GNAT superfamily N-acetyltransferase
MNIKYKLNNSNVTDIYSHFRKCDKIFVEEIEKRIDLKEYSIKLFNKAINIEAWYNNLLIGLLSIYKNDIDGYITNVSVIETYTRKGIASALIKQVIIYSSINGLSNLTLEVNKNNLIATEIYKKYGFKVIKEKQDYYTMSLKTIKEFKWKKLGLLFNPLEHKVDPWLNEYAQSPATLIFDDFVRVYFSCRSQREPNGQITSYSAFVDFDRKDIFKIVKVASKPVFKLGDRGCFDEFGTYPMSAIKKDNEIWAYYAGWTRCVSVPFNTAIGIAISNDNGETFNKIGDGPILSYSIDEPFILSVPKIRKFNDTYYMFYVSGKKWVHVDGNPEMVLKIRMATSQDGINWHKINKNLIVEKEGDDESQASPDVIYRNGIYHMFFDYWDPLTYRKTKNRRIGYAYSTDLINWTRNDKMVGIRPSPDESAFDHEMVAYPHVFELDGKIYMLYLGNEVGRYGFGIAVLENELI